MGSIPKTNSYNAELANTGTNLVDINFHPFPVDRNTGIHSIININCDQKFCPKEFRDAILNMIIYHFHLHPLIPNDQNQFLSTNDIWLLSVQDFVFRMTLKMCGLTYGQIGIRELDGIYGLEQRFQKK